MDIIQNFDAGVKLHFTNTKKKKTNSQKQQEVKISFDFWREKIRTN